ncbi:hypothetical protein OEB94_03915 [Streptomyces sp. ICN988]|uniref:hypothetical protein n=1 Tax=Streptomyces sp. ICN988 TaxID=2983765 RepID=UPI0021E3B6F7|nr:hypothetical protein [Streptomyces sp. ICN988]MCV2458427.1 hypothetical protein [Streptomyces sp. ICN988]
MNLRSRDGWKLFSPVAKAHLPPAGWWVLVPFRCVLSAVLLVAVGSLVHDLNEGSSLMEPLTLIAAV